MSVLLVMDVMFVYDLTVNHMTAKDNAVSLGNTVENTASEAPH